MTKPRKLSPTALLENRAFLKILARTGNVRLAAREVGVAHTTFLHRRSRHPAFAARWDAALAVVQARLGGFRDEGADALEAAPVAEQLAGRGRGPLVWRYKKMPRLDRHASESHDVDPVGFAAGRPGLAVSRDKDACTAPLTLSSAARTQGRGPLVWRYKTEKSNADGHASESHDSSVLSATRQAGRGLASLHAVPAARAAPASLHSALRTVAGDIHYCRRADGTVQVRRAIGGRLTRAAEQAFLTALAATCNVSLAAAAVGAAPAAFFKRRKRDPAFAREMKEALRRGYARLELALLESGVAGADGELDWRSNEPPALPPMSVSQALQLMYLHQKEARWRHEPWPIRRLRGESLEAHCYRLETMAEAGRQEQRDAFDMAEAERWAEGQPAWGPAGEAVRAELGLPEDGGHDRFLPDLAQVAGWSRAQGRVHDAGTALFGGWRLEQLQAFYDAQGEATQAGCRGASRTVGSKGGEGGSGE